MRYIIILYLHYFVWSHTHAVNSYSYFISKNNSELRCSFGRHNCTVICKSEWAEKVCNIRQTVAFKHKISKSNAKVSAHYQIMGPYSEDICYDIFKVCSVITIYTQSYPVSSYCFALIKIYYVSPILHTFW